MDFLFGNIFVCNTTEIAKKIAFDPKIRVRTINIEGDIFDP
jgi:structural maintenance of chromosome 2